MRGCEDSGVIFSGLQRNERALVEKEKFSGDLQGLFLPTEGQRLGGVKLNLGLSTPDISIIYLHTFEYP